MTAQAEVLPLCRSACGRCVGAGLSLIHISGFWVWHEQPSFCAAICHTPMDEYLETYEQEPGTTGVDKWGNEVRDVYKRQVPRQLY